ncbi:MAG: ribonuclease [Firmicutes bacterium]|nr:ribonuclease [Bacillota bacterium]
MARDYTKNGSSRWNKFLRIVLVILIVVFVLFYIKSLLTPPDEYEDPGEIDVTITDGGDQSGEDGGTQGGTGGQPDGTAQSGSEQTAPEIDEAGTYTSKDDVALYIHTYGHLPSNFITKKEAQALGWDGGSLEPYAPGKSIGGDRFGNYEKLLPTGHTYTECDIDTKGKKSRGAKRIVFSSDGLIYYTGDHYESFELLYGEE